MVNKVWKNFSVHQECYLMMLQILRLSKDPPILYIISLSMILNQIRSGTESDNNDVKNATYRLVDRKYRYYQHIYTYGLKMDRKTGNAGRRNLKSIIERKTSERGTRLNCWGISYFLGTVIY
jgi:hypothetical protein